MARLFFGNFDFEHELAARGYSPTKILSRLNAELCWHLTAFAEPSDAVHLPALPTDEFVAHWHRLTGGCRLTSTMRLPDRFTAHSWGWSQQARDLAEQSGHEVAAPSIEVVQQANSRRSSFEIEERLGLRLPGSFAVTGMTQLMEQFQQFNVTSPGGKWLIKAEFGMSARERVVGCGAELEPQTRGWIEKRLARHEWLVFEPFLDRIAEAGILLDVSPPTSDSDAVRVVTVTELLTDARGQYLGTRVDAAESWGTFSTRPPGNETSTLKTCSTNSGSNINNTLSGALAVARELQQLGYFGPIGIDAMQYRGTNREGATVPMIRPIQDINARYTMGFVATALARRLAPQRVASWLLLPTKKLCRALQLEPTTSAESQCLKRAGLDLTTALLGRTSEVQALLTSPFMLGEELTRQAGILLIGPTREDVTRAEAVISDYATTVTSP